MASKRILKKEINYLTEELINECFLYKEFHPEMGDDALYKVLVGITNTRNELLNKINHSRQVKDSKELKSYFQSILAQLPGLVEQMEALKK